MNRIFITTPLGIVCAEVTERGVCRVVFCDQNGTDSAFDARLEQFSRQINEYFSGVRTSFDVDRDAVGTPFQQKVWAELRRIPYGATVSYSEIARRLGAPRSTRAVASACARNPICLLVPCHRVVGAHGHLTGYAWGLERKRRLLELEQEHAPL